MVIRILTNPYSSTISAGVIAETRSVCGMGSGSKTARENVRRANNPGNPSYSPSPSQILKSLVEEHTQATIRAVLSRNPSEFSYHAQIVGELGVQIESFRRGCEV